MYIYTCFSCTVHAEENPAPVTEQPVETIPQQTAAEVKPGVQEDTDEHEISEPKVPDDTPATDTTIKEVSSDDTQRTTGNTPQPPLIDPQEKPSYGPKNIDSAPQTDKVTATDEAIITPPVPVTEKPAEAEKSSDDGQRTIGNTPQPPLIDSQVKPSYGPKDVDAASQTDKATLTDETIETLPAPATEKPAEAGEAGIVGEPAETLLVEEEFPESTDTEQEEVTTEKTQAAAEQPAKKWSETYPVSINADWLQLKSGEWLRGRITIMQKDSLEFDSDELDDLVIEWKNVKYLKSYEPYSLRFDSQGRASIIGKIEVIDDKVHVKTDYDDQTFDRSDLLTIASGKETEISNWKNKITFSINIRKGNTDQTDFTSKMTAKRRTTDSRLALDYLGNFTQVEEAETINNHRVNETYDIFLSRDLFWTPIFSEYFRDPFQNIDHRINAGIGIGYSIINTTETEWDISAGPAYQETKFVSVQPGGKQVASTVTLALGTDFETEINDRVDIEGLYSISLGDEETGNYSHHSLLTVETELTDKLDFDVTAVWDYVRSPVTDQHGITPDQDDFRIMIGLGYDL